MNKWQKAFSVSKKIIKNLDEKRRINKCYHLKKERNNVFLEIMTIKYGFYESISVFLPRFVFHCQNVIFSLENFQDYTKGKKYWINLFKFQFKLYK